MEKLGKARTGSCPTQTGKETLVPASYERAIQKGGIFPAFRKLDELTLSLCGIARCQSSRALHGLEIGRNGSDDECLTGVGL
jgi:hypothetical protein